MFALQQYYLYMYIRDTGIKFARMTHILIAIVSYIINCYPVKNVCRDKHGSIELKPLYQAILLGMKCDF